MTSTMNDTRTVVFTASPWTTVELPDGVPDTLLAALIADPRAIAPVVTYEPDTHRLEALFQVAIESTGYFEQDPSEHLEEASGDARAIFDNALIRGAHLQVHTVGLSIVAGDDAAQLP